MGHGYQVALLEGKKHFYQLSVGFGMWWGYDKANLPSGGTPGW